VADSAMHRICAHCGSEGQQRLGYCKECEGPVCERCGNTQIIRGERTVMHDSCLKFGEGSSFTMIKFVR